MNRVLQHDEAGWMEALLCNEGPRPRRPVSGEHPIEMATFADADVHQAFRVVNGEVYVPHDNREAWKRFRQLGHTGEEALRRAHALLELRGRYPDAGAAAGPIAHGSLHGHILEIPEVPGLSIRPFGPDDLDVLAEAMIAGGLHSATCPPDCGRCAPPEAHAWLYTAARLANGDAWQFCLDFQGRPLQHEIVLRDGLTAVFSLTVHHTRERPSWFWREAERPVYELLASRGIHFLESRTRSDRPDWIQSLKDNYGATELGTAGSITRLGFPLDMARFQGWPARIRLGHDATTGRVHTWEAADSDLPALKALIAQDVPATRRDVALRMVDEWWHLDRATFILGAKDGVLRYARALRPRKSGLAGLAHLGAMYDEPEQADVSAHVRGWCRRAGYTKVSSFVPTRLMTSGNMQAQLARAGARAIRERSDWRESFTEIEVDV